MHSIDNETFLQAVFGDLPEDETIAVCMFAGKPENQQYWTAQKAEDAPLDQRLNAFFCVSSVEKQKLINRRKKSLKACFVIPLDDIGSGDGAKTKHEDVPLQPSYKIETSPDNWQYGYILEHPIEDMAVAQALIKTVSQIADTGAAIPNKLIRLPFGKNSKEKYGLPAPATRLTDWAPERRFTIDQLLMAWDVKREVFDAEVAGLHKAVEPSIATNTDDDILKWMEFKGMVRTDTVVDEKGFYEVVCPWHMLHTSGTDTAGYSPIGEGGAEFAGARQFKCLHSHCDHRTEVNLTHWMFNDRFAFNATDAVVHDKLYPDVRYKSQDHFKRVFAPLWYMVPKDPTKPEGAQVQKFPTDDWLKRRDRITVAREEFFPKNDETGVRRDMLSGERRFNTFEPFDYPFTEHEDKLTPILEHLEYMFGSELDNLIGYLAHTVHRPFNRLPFALLHVAHAHGTGRGWLKRLCAALLRKRDYAQNPSFSNWVKGNFNEFLYRSLLVSFDEVYDRAERFTIGERLRELITENVVEINVKHGFKGSANIYANFMFFSNHMDALAIPDADRRFWCVMCEKGPRHADVYKVLYGLLDDTETMGQFWWFLRRALDTTELDPTGRAPITEWTEAMQAANEDVTMDTPIKETIGRLRMLGAEMVWRKQLIDDCRANGAEIPNPLIGSSQEARRLEAILKDMGVQRHPIRLNNDNGGKDIGYFLVPRDRVTGDMKHACMSAEEFKAPISNQHLNFGDT